MTKKRIDHKAVAIAMKEEVVQELKGEMAKQGITRAEMARRMGVNLSSVQRLLDPKNVAVNLLLVIKGADAIGKRVEIRFG